MSHERFHFSDLDAMERMISKLGLDIPFSDDISVLFSPVYMPGKTLLNRFVVLPMEGADSDPSGRPSELTLRRYKRFAEGGSGTIWFEATAVAAEARSNPHQLWIHPETKNGFRRLVKETRLAAHRKFGHDHNLLLILQLTHSGRFARPDGRPAPVVAQPNPVLDTSAGFSADPQVISDGELDALGERFAAAAGLAAEVGFDGVDIKACHGYLVSELLAAQARPDSRYGGSFENRIRFLVETSQKIRRETPELIVTSRLSVFDAIPQPYGFGVDVEDAERPDLGEPIELIRRLVRLGNPLIGISLGIPAHRPHFGRPYDKPLIGQDLPAEHPLVGVARWLRLTAEVQRAFPSLPIVGAGYSWLRRFFPQTAAAMVERGRASLIGLGREALAYPDCVNDLAANGLLDSRRVCLSCSKCSQMLRTGTRVGCAVHDAAVYQAEYRRARKLAKEVQRNEKRSARTAKRRKRRKS
jgi:2,4-dienoyl-CoA reductase-like NADH-dependent reductase (Old Yellow Enzyme family)